MVVQTAKSIKMQLPIGISQISIAAGIAAVIHHVIAHLQAAVSDAAGILAHRSLKEDDVAGFGILWTNRLAVPIQGCRAHVTDVVHTSAGK